ncbi:MAG: PspC domain-containing protein [Methanofollis sp.]|uniref:PspC domain-containing protein n=1 Tax=Methanofollis sp. TaxID=2052835 RepID=UPI00261CEF56|nr:PspC domain-containing protein [Methanofollis sp.]MDD4255692.1 PspC domain-containing protein [Methanofollis sp.]
MAEKRLVRPKNDRMIAGVCSGIARYLGVDPAIVRIAWVILSLFGYIVFGVLAYILAVIIIPEEEKGVLDADFTVKEEEKA